jgi:O-antigen ligase
MVRTNFNNLDQTLLKIFFLNIFLLPIYPDNLKPSMVALFLLSSIISVFKNRASGFFSKKKINTIFFINSSMFLVIFLGLFYSEDIDYGFKYLIRIIPFIVFPVCFLLLQKNKFIFSEKTLNTGKLLFYLSTLFFFLSIFMFFYGKGYVTENYFLNYSHRITSQLGKYSIHPIYASIYVAIALIVSVNFIKKKKYLYLFITGDILLLINLILLSRKSAILIMLVLLLLYLVFNKTIYFKWKIISLISVIMMSFLVVKFTPDISNRFRDLENIFKNNQQESSSNLRINIYKSSILAINENPILGYGIGDSKNILSLFEKKQKFLKGNYYNTHNQFLGYLISNGIVGLSFFLLILFKNFNIAASSSFEHLSILLLFTFMMMIENVLDRQNGIILFSFLLNYFSFKNLINSAK